MLYNVVLHVPCATACPSAITLFATANWNDALRMKESASIALLSADLSNPAYQLLEQLHAILGTPTAGAYIGLSA